jgi:hypothetical protein
MRVHVTPRFRAAAIIESDAAAPPDDVPVWADRSGRLHPAMPLTAFNGGDASLDSAFLHTPLVPPPVTSVPHNTSVIAAVLRV